MKKDILQDIIANKRIEVARQKQAVSLQTLLALGSDRMERDTRSMRAALESSPSGIIAEFKRKSPSKGWLHPGRISPTWCPLTRPEAPPPARSLRTGISSEVPWATCKRPVSWWISRYFARTSSSIPTNSSKPG